MNKQETHGKVNELKGRMKEAAGIITADRELEQKGSQQRAGGEIQESLGKARRKVGEVVGDVAKSIKK